MADALLAGVADIAGSILQKSDLLDPRFRARMPDRDKGITDAFLNGGGWQVR